MRDQPVVAERLVGDVERDRRPDAGGRQRRARRGVWEVGEERGVELEDARAECGRPLGRPVEIRYRWRRRGSHGGSVTRGCTAGAGGVHADRVCQNDGWAI